MQYTIERLINGDQTVVEQFKAATARWKIILKEIPATSVEALAKRLTTEQFWFENHCGGRWEGQEIMAWSAFGSLYTTDNGFDDNDVAAQNLAKAFKSSMCSIEVKGYARRAAESYGI